VPKPKPRVKSIFDINFDATIYSAANKAEPPKSLNPTATCGIN